MSRFNIRITRHSVAYYLDGVGEEVFGLNADIMAPHHHVLHTPGHYACLEPIPPCGGSDVNDDISHSGGDGPNSPSATDQQLAPF
jgi:hypothetical protein